MSVDIETMTSVTIVITEKPSGVHGGGNLEIANSSITSELDIAGDLRLAGKVYAGGAVLTSDWAVTDAASNAYIKNKPSGAAGPTGYTGPAGATGTHGTALARPGAGPAARGRERFTSPIAVFSLDSPAQRVVLASRRLVEVIPPALRVVRAFVVDVVRNAQGAPLAASPRNRTSPPRCRSSRTFLATTTDGMYPRRGRA